MSLLFCSLSFVKVAIFIRPLEGIIYIHFYYNSRHHRGEDVDATYHYAHAVAFTATVLVLVLVVVLVVVVN